MKVDELDRAAADPRPPDTSVTHHKIASKVPWTLRNLVYLLIVVAVLIWVFMAVAKIH